ncbi:hypothetical protein GE09DRAFT_958018 [Coniochaeta sp. 2T2.1]|nr:hypothetical protein GE09DRAFT_958018 [Coniochaeta sp. 2T2.1]
MEFLSNFSTTTIVISTAVLAVTIAFTMGAFFSKNRFPVEGRTILLTGSTEGMGRAAALQLAAKGANLILIARNVGRLEEILADCKAAALNPGTQRFTYISADISKPNWAEPVLAEAMAWNGGHSPDIIWAIAGMSIPLLWADPEVDAIAACRRQMDVNFFGAAELSRAALREWLAPENKRGKGAEPKQLVFTASVLAWFPIVGYSTYSPSKWALRSLADTLAMELRLYPENPVEVHVVYPATIKSPGLVNENKTKPAVTQMLEQEEPEVEAEDVASRAIAGLQRGETNVPVSFLGNLMRLACLGGGPRNNWVTDTIGSWFLPIIYFFVLIDMHGKIDKWVKKHGQPIQETRQARYALRVALPESPSELGGSPTMNGIMRPTRGGRPNKVVKNSAVQGTPARGRGRPPAHVSQLQQSSPEEVRHPEYDEGAIMNELNAAAAAAAAAAAISVAENAEMGEAEAEADMEDDDQDLHHQQHHNQTDHMDLNTAANILANGGSITSGGQLTPSADHQQHQMQQHHQPTASMGGPSPHHMDQHNQNLDPSFVRTTEELARDSGYGQLNVESALAKRLAREPGLRIAQQRRPDQQLNLQRRSNVEALFAHIAGELAPSACKNCHKGHGPWTSCVVVDGQMCGSCANCWFNASGARCSFHETRNPQAQHQPVPLMSTPSAPPSDPNASYMVHAPPPSQPQLAQPALPATPAHNATLAALGHQGSNDPVVRYTVERAMAEVRTADRRTRQIMMIEIAAKQLALQIVEYEESNGNGPNGQQQPQQQQQQVLHGGHNGQQAQNGGHQDGAGNGVAS